MTITAMALLGHESIAQPKKKNPAARRHRCKDEDGPEFRSLTHAQIEAEILRLLKRGDPMQPQELADEIGVHAASIANRLRALTEKNRRVRYRVQSNFTIAWWRNPVSCEDAYEQCDRESRLGF